MEPPDEAERMCANIDTLFVGLKGLNVELVITACGGRSVMITIRKKMGTGAAGYTVMACRRPEIGYHPENTW